MAAVFPAKAQNMPGEAEVICLCLTTELDRKAVQSRRGLLKHAILITKNMVTSSSEVQKNI
jgi:hypothetical protein